MKEARALAFPNCEGQISKNSVRDSPQATPLLPLVLWQSGSLGRWLVRDPSLCRVVTTTACLFRFHRENVVADFITEMIMEARSTAIDKQRSSSTRPLLRYVVGKIVTSVSDNVVNSGHDTSSLPPNLREVCLRGHKLSAGEFGKVVSILQRPRPRLIVQSKHLLQNLSLWLLLHFDGRLVISVSGRILFEESLGDARAEIELKAATFCSSSSKCETLPGGNGDIEVIDVAEDLKRLFSSTYITGSGFTPDPQVRQELYKHTPTYVGSKAGLSSASTSASKIYTRCSAQEIMKWMLNLPIASPKHTQLGFEILLGRRASATGSSSLSVSTLLKRVTGILNKKWGDEPPSDLVYVKPAEDDPIQPVGSDRRDSSSDESSARWSEEEREDGFDQILPYFPILRDLVQKVQVNVSASPVLGMVRVKTSVSERAACVTRPWLKL